MPVDDARVGMWAVGFLDLMGYQGELAKTDVFPLPSREKALEMFRRVVSRRLAIADVPRVVIADMESVYKPRPSFSPIERRVADRLKPIRVVTTGFSDSVFLYTSLDDIENRISMIALAQLVMASAITLFSNLVAESPIRGGIDISAGIFVSDHLDSAAAAKAVNLEKLADYPRILVGQRFVEYLQEGAVVPGDASMEYMHRKMANDLLSTLYTDPDDPPGSPQGIDYLGAAFRQFMPVEREDVLRVWQFATKSRDTFRRAGDQHSRKISRKYERLIAYIEAR